MRASVRTSGGRSCAGTQRAERRVERAPGAYSSEICYHGGSWGGPPVRGRRVGLSRYGRVQETRADGGSAHYRRPNSWRTRSTTCGMAAATPGELHSHLAELTVTRIQMNSVS